MLWLSAQSKLQNTGIKWWLDVKVSLLPRRADEEHNGSCAGMGLVRRRHSTSEVGEDYRGEGLFW